LNAAYISAFSALAGSAIGALASLCTTWLTQTHQDRTRRRAQETVRRERVFVEFIDLSSKVWVDALVQTAMDDPTKIVPLYATMGKLRLFASRRTIEAAEQVMEQLVETYYAPKFDLQSRPSIDSRADILRAFADACRDELSVRK
jgi:hypothetical protein